jgi:hypothetical protein
LTIPVPLRIAPARDIDRHVDLLIFRDDEN